MELADERTTWNRSLWQIGALVGLREVLEYVEGLAAGSMKIEGLQHVATSMAAQVAKDEGIGSLAVRDRVTGILHRLNGFKDSAANKQDVESLRQYCVRIEADYLENWHNYVDAGNIPEQRYELIARAVMNHLLEAGFDRSHLHGWVRSRSQDGASFSALLGDARNMLAEGDKKYTLVIPFERMSKKVSEALGDLYVTPESYVSMVDASDQKILKNIRRPAGAARIEMRAKDPHAAVRSAYAWAQRLKARIAVGLETTKLSIGDYVFDETSRKLRPLRPELPEVRILALQRNAILIPDVTNVSRDSAQIDDALELLASLEQSSSGASIATTWAAVETLLGRPGAGSKGVDAADRLADIVTCGFPSAEFARLAQAPLSEGSSGSLRDSLRDPTTSSTQKAEVLFGIICSGERLLYEDPKDAASFIRARYLAMEPVQTMKRVRGYYRDSFRRLYYQRNLIMHSGKFDSVSLASTVRTLPVLTAAGVDRIIRARFTAPSVDPIGLAARAANELELLGAAGARPVHRLI